MKQPALRQGDLAYLDPPYNQHSYLGNYHVWETLVRWDEPEFGPVSPSRSSTSSSTSPPTSARKCWRPRSACSTAKASR